MKVTVAILVKLAACTFLYPGVTRAQKKSEKFLMYYPSVTTTIYRAGGITTYDTSFWSANLFVLGESKAYSNTFDYFGKKKGYSRKTKGKFKRTGDEIIFYGDSIERARIFRDSIVPKGAYKDMKILLVPISNGVKLSPITGQLIYPNGNKIILKGTKEDTTFYSTFLCNEDKLSYIERGRTEFDISEDVNASYFGGTGEFLQFTGNRSDSIFNFNRLSTILRVGDTINKTVSLVLRKKPSPEFINNRKRTLLGEWTMTGGTILKDTIFIHEKLVGCNYQFTFKDDLIIVKREFINPSYQSSSTTLKYELNSTGDFLEFPLETSFRPTLILRKLDKTTSSWTIDEFWMVNNRRKRVQLKLEMSRK